MTLRGTSWLSVLISFSAFAPAVALAESALAPCYIGAPWPASGDVPFDQPAFVVPGYSNIARDEMPFQLVATLGDGPPTLVPVTARREDDAFVLEPMAALPIGANLELRGTICSGHLPSLQVSVLYRVVDATAVPPAPPLRLEARVTGYVEGGYYHSFRGEVDMHVDGGGVLEDWVPWVEPYLFIGAEFGVAEVIDRRASGAVELSCRGIQGRVEPGSHRVVGRLEAWDGTTLGEVAELVSFDCDEARFVERWTGRELSSEEVARLRPAPYAGTTWADAGVHDAGPDDAAGDGGCSASSAGGVGAVWLVAALAWRRSRDLRLRTSRRLGRRRASRVAS